MTGKITRRYSAAVASTPIRNRTLARFAEHAREILGPKLLELRLFGSEARGEAGPGSDLDVLVVVQPDTERAILEDRVIDIAFDVTLNSAFISPHEWSHAASWMIRSGAKRRS